MNRVGRQPLQQQPQSAAATAHKQFIALNGKRMAALAWHGFQREGRGMIVVNENNCVAGKRWEDGESVAAFVPLSYIERTPDTPPKHDAIRMLTAYDPTVEFVVNILRADGGASFYRISGSVSPRDAYEQLAHSPDFLPQRPN